MPSTILCWSFSFSSLHGLKVLVFENIKTLDSKAVGIVIRTGSVQEAALRLETPSGDVALPDDELRGIGHGAVGIGVEAAHHAVYPERLVDAARDDAVVIALFSKVGIAVVGALVRQEQGAADIVFDGALVGREGEEEFVETPHMLPRFGGAVLRQVLREGEHQALAPVQYVNLLALPLGEPIGTPQRVAHDSRAQAEEDDAEQAYLPERAFDVL